MKSPDELDGQAASSYAAPKLQCDLVMKGGVTSGVVYPPALCVLAEEYRFRSIGGASAGAIAAAGAAAAEFGRESGGFEKLKKLSAWIGEDEHLLGLFQPNAGTKPLFDLLLAAMHERGRIKARPVRGIVDLVRRTIKPASSRDAGLGAGVGVGVGVGLALLLTAALAVAFWLYDRETGRVAEWDRLLWPALTAAALVLAAIFGLAGWWVGRIVGRCRFLFSIVSEEIPKNYLGVCRGRTTVTGGSVALTDWLSENLNDLAGRPKNGPPLTFGDLAAKTDPDGQPVSIALKMVTTNLSQGRPYIFPLEGNRFVFCAAEMREFFPDEVVDYMVDKGLTRPYLPSGYYFLPSGGDLPVVVATRMSLSFPVLLSAVPLYTIKLGSWKKYRAEKRAGRAYVFDPAEDLQRNWLSDGGISSNFPIHFFDAWLPTRPTFGISLSSLPREVLARPEERLIDHIGVPDGRENGAADLDEEPGTDATEKAVYLPKANQNLPPDWTAVEGLPGLIGGIWRSAQNYRDTTQLGLPSYRDRVVQIRLADDEGGLNLAMKPETIMEMVRKGRQAGMVLRQEFDFDHHRWVRFRVLTAQLEAQLTRLVRAFDEVAYEELISGKLASDRGAYPYPRQPSWCKEAICRFAEVRRLLQQWEDLHRAWQAENASWTFPEFFNRDSPQPQPILRVTPDL